MTKETSAAPSPIFETIGATAPVLAAYTRNRIVEELWNRPGLAKRDRAIVTVSALISRNAANAYHNYLTKALDSGVAPRELSELITHIAFYAGFPYAFAALPILRTIFEERGIGVNQLPQIMPDLLPAWQGMPDSGPEDASALYEWLDEISPALVHFTEALLDDEVWRRPDLSLRDRSLATVAALSALGQVKLLPRYLNRALESGITRKEIGEALPHVAFYAGWGNAVNAARAIKFFFDTTPGQS